MAATEPVLAANGANIADKENNDNSADIDNSVNLKVNRRVGVTPSGQPLQS